MRKKRKTTSEDEEDHYNEILELLSDAQLLKTMLNVGSGYPNLMKGIKVKNDGIPNGLVSFNYKMFVGKDVSYIVSNICAPD